MGSDATPVLHCCAACVHKTRRSRLLFLYLEEHVHQPRACLHIHLLQILQDNNICRDIPQSMNVWCKPRCSSLSCCCCCCCTLCTYLHQAFHSLFDAFAYVFFFATWDGGDATDMCACSRADSRPFVLSEDARRGLELLSFERPGWIWAHKFHLWGKQIETMMHIRKKSVILVTNAARTGAHSFAECSVIAVRLSLSHTQTQVIAGCSVIVWQDTVYTVAADSGWLSRHRERERVCTGRRVSGSPQKGWKF